MASVCSVMPVSLPPDSFLGPGGQSAIAVSPPLGFGQYVAQIGQILLDHCQATLRHQVAVLADRPFADACDGVFAVFLAGKSSAHSLNLCPPSRLHKSLPLAENAGARLA